MTRLSEVEARRLLGVAEDATRDEIKQAYRDLVRMCHPDRHEGDDRLRRKAQALTQDVIAAYDLLASLPSATPATPAPPHRERSSTAKRPQTRETDRGPRSSPPPRDPTSPPPRKEAPKPEVETDIPCQKCRKPTKPAATKCGHCWAALPQADERRRLDVEHRAREAANKRSRKNEAGSSEPNSHRAAGRIPLPVLRQAGSASRHEMWLLLADAQAEPVAGQQDRLPNRTDRGEIRIRRPRWDQIAARPQT